jgi:2,3-bisphosphoglycerate-independent phosphoglycerate mutase
MRLLSPHKSNQRLQSPPKKEAKLFAQEEIDIQSIPRQVHFSSNMDTRVIENLHDNMIKQKVFHKDYKLNACDPTNEFERKIKKMEKDWPNSNDVKDKDILEYFEKKEREIIKRNSVKHSSQNKGRRDNDKKHSRDRTEKFKKDLIGNAN